MYVHMHKDIQGVFRTSPSLPIKFFRSTWYGKYGKYGMVWYGIITLKQDSNNLERDRPPHKILPLLMIW